jgi:WS/DGAT/MGAT family acyltransferase
LPGRGQADALNALDTLSWRCRTDPMLRSPVLVVSLLDRTPDWSQVVTWHRRAARAVPRLCQRPVPASSFDHRYRWESDPQFDAERHLRRLAVPGDGGRAELLTLVRDIAVMPFEERHPPWDSTFVEGVRWQDDERAAWILRLHHCMADGRTIGLWLNRLLSGRHSGQPVPIDAGARDDRPRIVLTAVADAMSLALERNLLPLPALRRSLSGAAAVARVVRRPVTAVHDTARTVRTLADMIPSPVCPPSPLLQARDTRRNLGMAHVPIGRLRKVAKTAGCSTTDAYLTALLLGLRHYHQEHGTPIDALPIGVPVSLPFRDSQQIGNRLGAHRFAAPLDEGDPRTLMETVSTLLRERRDIPVPSVLDAVYTLVNALPTGPMIELVGRIFRSQDIHATLLPGIYRPYRIAGSAITDAYCFAPAAGCAVMAVLLAHHDHASLGVTMDAAAVEDPEGLMRAFDNGFREVLEIDPKRDPADRIEPIA